MGARIGCSRSQQRSLRDVGPQQARLWACKPARSMANAVIRMVLGAPHNRLVMLATAIATLNAPVVQSCPTKARVLERGLVRDHAACVSSQCAI